ncbi:hypothetical protein BD560DRAFT_392316 [Blakeslea trispora]|nr:hypothetical protein BD560DRAFT_392316 [Blakeslea trispora]
MLHLQELPIDILIAISNHLDPLSKLQLSLTCQLFASLVLKTIWRFPTCHSSTQLASMIQTLHMDSLYDYSQWIEKVEVQQLSSAATRLFMIHPSVMPKAVHFNSTDTGNLDQGLLGALLHTDVRQIEFTHCSYAFLTCFVDHLSQQRYDALTHLSFSHCMLSDMHIQRIVQQTANLRHLSCQQSAYISDKSIMSIVQACPLIETLIITLPSYLSQANTITLASLEVLCQCQSLSTFICQGQVRIASADVVKWLLDRCLSLKHCVLAM